jgi:hypothetical protein
VTYVPGRSSGPTAFTVAQFKQDHVRGGDLIRVPASMAHGKVMGTTATLCGLPALSWHKFWGLPFADVRGERCPRCAAAVIPSAPRG